MKNKRAIVSMIIGDKYIKPWSEKFLPGWLAYCEKHSIDLIVFFNPFDNSERAKKRKVNWQKCLALISPEAKEYEQVLWLDADIAINPVTAPDIFVDCPVNKVGAIGLRSFPTQNHLLANSGQPDVEVLHECWSNGGMLEAIKRAQQRADSQSTTIIDNVSQSIEEFYKSLGFPYKVGNTFNSGVFIINPNLHENLFRRIYSEHDQFDHLRVSDNIPIPAEVYHAGLLHEIDSRFNVILYNEIATSYPFLIFAGEEYEKLLFLCCLSAFIKSYFLHFAGTQVAQDVFVPVSHTWNELMRVGGNTFPSLYFEKSTMGSLKHARSYFDNFESVVGKKHALLSFDSGLFRFFPKSERRSIRNSISVNDVKDGFYKIEKDGGSGQSFRWIKGDGGIINVPITIDRGAWCKFESRIELLGSTDRSFLDLQKLIVKLNGFCGIGYKFSRDPVATPGIVAVDIHGFGFVTPGDNTIEIVGHSWSPFANGESDDGRCLGMRFSSMTLNIEVI